MPLTSDGENATIDCTDQIDQAKTGKRQFANPDPLCTFRDARAAAMVTARAG